MQHNFLIDPYLVTKRSILDRYYESMIHSKISIALDFFEGKKRDYIVNPSLLRPTCLRAASSFSGRTYSLINRIHCFLLNFSTNSIPIEVIHER